jgi:hypothetical protein
MNSSGWIIEANFDQVKLLSSSNKTGMRKLLAGRRVHGMG